MSVVSYRNSTSNHNAGSALVSPGAVVSYRNSTSNHNGGSRYSDWLEVVSYRNSTSNHNGVNATMSGGSVVSYRNSTSNHNVSATRSNMLLLYLIEILHQTTTRVRLAQFLLGCILSKFYIKPQQCKYTKKMELVVSYRNSTSNHNRTRITTQTSRLYLIEILHQTTTLAYPTLARGELYLIEILHQTTTRQGRQERYRQLYLIEILHQTTTMEIILCHIPSCILSKFYIKPQLNSDNVLRASCCILSKFYIKPQLRIERELARCSCILSKFYIKPQRRASY